MTYSLDIRERAVGFVQAGGSQAEATRVFGIDRKTLYHWLRCKTLVPKVCGPRRRKLDKAKLAAHVRACPDALLRERAEHFGVRTNAIWVALRQMDIVKKNDAIRGESFR